MDRNEMRSSIIFTLYHLRKICNQRESESKMVWQHENWVLLWKKPNLYLNGFSYNIVASESGVDLDDSIEAVYQVPITWLRSLTDELKRQE
jgi:hypothetical protein